MTRRHVLEVQENRGGNDLDGVPVEDWQTVRVVYAAITPLSGREYVANRQAKLETTHKIETEPLFGVTSAMRLKDGERIFNVESVVNVDERNRRLLWMCREAA